MKMMIKDTKKAIQRIYFAQDIAALKKELSNFYNSKVVLIDITGRGATFTFRVTDGSGKDLGVVKLVNPKRENLSKEVNSRLEEYEYLEPEKRFSREFDILGNLSEQKLTPKPIKVTRTYLLQEYLQGPNLARAVFEDQDKFLELYFQGFKVLNKLHQYGIYHGQPSMENMILSEGQIRVVDFEHCLNAKKFNAQEMCAIDILRFVLDTAATFPQLHAHSYNRLSEFLNSEMDEGIIKRMQDMLTLSIFKNNDSAKKLISILATQRKAEVENIVIVPIIKTELESLLALYSEVALADKKTLRKGIFSLYNRFPKGMFVARKNNKIVAYISIGFQKPRFILRCLGRLPFSRGIVDILQKNSVFSECEIASVYVGEKYRKAGIATKLVEFAEEFARLKLKENVIFLLVRKSNVAAYSLYEKQGFKKWATVRVDGGNKIKMRKELK